MHYFYPTLPECFKCYVCTCESGKSVCSVEGKSRSSTLLGSPRQQLVSFIHLSLLMSISSASTRRAGASSRPSMDAGVSLGPSTRPFLPWRNSQSREEPYKENHKAIPSGKRVLWKRLGLVETLSLGVAPRAM